MVRKSPRLSRTKAPTDSETSPEQTSYQRRKEALYLRGGDKLVQEFLKAESLRVSMNRLQQTPEQRAQYNSKARIRQARYRYVLLKI